MSRNYSCKRLSLVFEPGSFLMTIHDKHGLAEDIVRIFEKREQTAPLDWTGRTAPGQEAMCSALTACEDQTASFDWRKILLAVASSMDESEKFIYEPIPAKIFEGLLSLLPLVQRFPEEHFLHIQTGSGVCSLIVWMHSVLGLSVLVKGSKHPGMRTRESVFGSDPNRNVTIDIDPDTDKDTITLLSCTSNEPLFQLEARHLDSSCPTYKRPARGSLKYVLENFFSTYEGKGALVEDLSEFICALAIHASTMHASNEIYAASPKSSSPKPSRTVRLSNEAQIRVSGKSIPQRTMDAAHMLLCDFRETGRVEQYFRLLSHNLISLKNPPENIAQHFSWIEKESAEYPWKMYSQSSLMSLVLRLSGVVQAFAHVTDIETAGDLPVYAKYCVFRKEWEDMFCKYYNESHPTKVLETRDGIWFRIIAELMQGHGEVDHGLRNKSEPHGGYDQCLFSNRGWSLFVNTLGDSKLAFSGKHLRRKRVPCKH